MRSPQSITLTLPTVHADALTWFRFGRLGERVILTTDTGDWHVLSPQDFGNLLSGELDTAGEDYSALTRKGFIRNGFDTELQATQIRRTKRFIEAGLSEHRIHLSTPSGTLAMEQAKAIVDHIFGTQGDALSIVLVQGPAELDANLVSFIHEFAEQKNQYERRAIAYELDSTLAGLDSAMAAQLVEKNIRLRARYGGTAANHDHLRGADQPKHADATATLGMVHQAVSAAGRTDYSVFGEVRVGSHALGHAEALVQGLAAAGIHEFRVTPELAGPGAIEPTDFGGFMGELMAVVESMNTEGVATTETQTDALLARIRTGDLADRVAMCTLPSTGYSARTYGVDGHIYPSGSALALHEDGDAMFVLGNVATDTAEDLSNHPTIRSLMVASLVDCTPGYRHLWSSPYIGIDPVAAYVATGDIFTKMPTSPHHRATHALVEAAFLHAIAAGD
ncbi:MAG: hypothetical protein VX944_06335 [Myxococcota bacterium]|nr:hypothetical protein [Myxococcota bacterium]